MGFGSPPEYKIINFGGGCLAGRALWVRLRVMATIPVDIKDAPTGVALSAIYDAVLALHVRFDTQETLMADLGPALDRLEASSAAILALVGTDLPALREALDAERAANATLTQQALDTAAAEDAEDVAQNAELADSVAARDAAVAQTDAAFGRIESVSSNLETAVTPPPEV